MKKPLKEVLALATPGPLRTLGLEHSNIIAPSGQVMAVMDKARPLPWKVNAALFAHMRNTYEELVALMQSAKEAADNCEDSLEGLIELRGWIADRFDSALARANTVEVPE